MKWIFYLILITILFTACNHNRIVEGVVFKKEFKCAKKEFKRQEHTRRTPRGNTITTSTLHQVSYPDRWVVYVHSADTKDTADFFVHKEVYDTIKVGSYFVFDTIMGRATEPIKYLK